MAIKHHNHEYDGGSPDIPLALGDRYYSQDLGRDFNYLRNLVGKVLADMGQTLPALVSGGVVTKGTGDTLDITPAVGYANHQVDVPDVFSSIPPAVIQEDVVLRAESAQQTDMAVPSAVLDGSTVNYVKLRYDEADENSRSRAKKAGSYYYEQSAGFSIVVNPTANTGYDVLLATFTGVPAGAFVIIQVDPALKIKDYMIDFGTGADQVDAGDVPSNDAGGRYTAADVDGQLQEIAGSGRLAQTVKGNADAILAIQYKGAVANKSDLPTSGVAQGDLYMVMNGGPSGGNMFAYVAGPYSEFGGWFDLDRARFCDVRWRGLSGGWITGSNWIKGTYPGATNRVAVTAGGLSVDSSTTVIDYLLGLCTFTVSGSRDLTIKGEFMCWPTAKTAGDYRFIVDAATIASDVYMFEGCWYGQLEVICTTYNVYMSGNMFCIGKSTAAPIVFTSGKFWVNGHTLHWVGDVTTEQTVTLVSTKFDNQTAGGLLVLRGKLGLNTSNHDLEDVHLKDLSSSTYINQYIDCTVGVLTIDAGCTWDQNGFNLTYDTLINNGTLIP